MNYIAPVAEIAFWIRAVAGFDEELAAGTFPEVGADLFDAVLEEAGRFATERLAPLERVGDREGSRLENGVVVTPAGWREAYRDWSAAGWTGLTARPEYGGQGLPTMLYAGTLEIWNGACLSFFTGPMLSFGAIETLTAHGSPEQRALYLPKLVDGSWTGTMNLTEPQSGSDLSTLRTRAEPVGDGSYRIVGQKIFISYGDHDLTENIVHLVLARLPDAPPGTRGISLFLVPKILLKPDGGLGARNDVRVVGLEHKLGLHGSPTCVMQYGESGGAIGWLVGEPHRGLAAMFTMMNDARMGVGLQGIGLAERAYQRARAFAAERRQGRGPGWTGEGPGPIVHHLDVRRMLLTMRALIDAGRALAYSLARAIDRSHAGPQAARAAAADRAALLTPVVKAFGTDLAVEVASLGVQIHGGMGFIEETGAAQHLRDARILPIYEGTNGIQAIDLVSRKLPLGGGAAVSACLADLRAIAGAARDAGGDLGASADLVLAALDRLAAATATLTGWLAEGRTDDALAGATAYLRLFALAAGATYHLKAWMACAGDDGPVAARRILAARFFATGILPATAGLAAAATAGSAVLGALTPDILDA